MADSNEVRVGTKGAFVVAPVGTTAPTTPYDAWGTGWVDLGYGTQDGLTESLNENRQTFDAWGETQPILTIVTSRQTQFKINLEQTNAWTLALYHGIDIADMTSSGSADTQFLSFNEPHTPEPQYYAIGADVFDQQGRPIRIVVARAEVTDKGDRSYKADTVAGFELTFSSLSAPGGASSITRMFGQVALPA
ncbi:phage tail protein [Streptomyces sp. NPDC021020]|uniref:phage tail tube protein n=1 Tax=Streptomyces sp. NPDC021020 TaxID=3365109 RepID=UPI0037BD0C3F